MTRYIALTRSEHTVILTGNHIKPLPGDYILRSAELGMCQVSCVFVHAFCHSIFFHDQSGKEPNHPEHGYQVFTQKPCMNVGKWLAAKNTDPDIKSYVLTFSDRR